MKSSSLHRAGLSRENMSALENSQARTPAKSDYSPYVKPSKTHELDTLWASVGKATDTIVTTPKAPGVYLLIGFIAGALFMGVISLIVGFSTMNSTSPAEPSVFSQNKTNVAIIAETPETQAESKPKVIEEKYEVKSGDTLDSIAYRFYGKYDVSKIREIQKLNNITDPNSIRIGQVILIPVEAR